MSKNEAIEKHDRLVRRLNYVKFLDMIDGRVELVRAFKKRYQHIFYAE